MSSTTTTAPGTVFITVPKFVTITPSPLGIVSSSPSSTSSTLPKLRPAPIQPFVSAANACSSPAHSSGYASSTCASDDGHMGAAGGHNDEGGSASKGKKRRLDHLTWEEKVQRKKLKNRVAAQTSRDRKKARMEEMEGEIYDLNEKTQILENKCESLQAINDSLLEKNQKLDMEVEQLRQQLNELQQQQQKQKQQQNATPTATATCAGCESILNGSAVSISTDHPLQQGSKQTMDSQSTREEELQQQLRRNSTMASLWRIVALCLLYKTCSSKSSMPASSKSSPKACSLISQQTWRQAIERAMKLLPKLQAVQSDCLDQWWGPQQSAWNPANIEVAA